MSSTYYIHCPVIHITNCQADQTADFLTGFGNWIYTYCVRQVGLSEAAGQQITSLYWLAFTLGRLPAVSALGSHP